LVGAAELYVTVLYVQALPAETLAWHTGMAAVVEKPQEVQDGHAVLEYTYVFPLGKPMARVSLQSEETVVPAGFAIAAWDKAFSVLPKTERTAIPRKSANFLPNVITELFMTEYFYFLTMNLPETEFLLLQ
jgi:hypothetical protein